MLTLIFVVVFGLVFGYFATQNTMAVTINFWQYTVPGIPLYLVTLVSLAAGLLITTFVDLIKSIFASLALSKKETLLQKSKEEVTDLVKRVHKLELENTKLRTELGQDTTDENSI